LVVLADFVEAVIKLFVIMNPIGNMPLFQSLIADATSDQKKTVAKKAAFVSFIVLLVFSYLGDTILEVLGIRLSYVMIAGGAFIFVFAVKATISWPRTESASTGNKKAAAPMSNGAVDQVAVFPIAVPLLAGPGAIATVMILNHPQYGVIQGLTDLSTGLAIVADCVIVWALFVLGNKLVQVVKPFTMTVIGKLMDILIGAIGISFLMRGIMATFGVPLPT
jgi:multiple antibiotic resistance protein